MSAAETTWIEANQRDLTAAIGEVRIALERVAKGEPVLGGSGKTAAPTSAAPAAAQPVCRLWPVAIRASHSADVRRRRA